MMSRTHGQGETRGQPGDGVGRLLRARRQALGLTLAQVAGRAGMAVSYLSMIETGRVAHPPAADRLRALAGALQMDATALLDAAAWEQTPAKVREQLAALRDRAAAGQDLARWLAHNTPTPGSEGPAPGSDVPAPGSSDPEGGSDHTPKAPVDRAEENCRGDFRKNFRGGGVDLDALFRSGELARRIGAALGDDGDHPHAQQHPHEQMPSASMSSVAPQRPAGRVPLINKVAAGLPDGFTDLDYPARVADDYVPDPSAGGASDVHDPDRFAATVTGESMLPQFKPGDIVVFSPAMDVREGDDCFVRLEPDHETTFKRVFFDRDADGGQLIRLQPLNPRFPPRVLPREQVSGMYRAVWRMSPL